MNDLENEAYMAGKTAAIRGESILKYRCVWGKQWKAFQLGYVDGLKDLKKRRGSACNK